MELDSLINKHNEKKQLSSCHFYLFTYDVSINLLTIYILDYYGMSIVIYETKPEMDTILIKASTEEKPNTVCPTSLSRTIQKLVFGRL